MTAPPHSAVPLFLAALLALSTVSSGCGEASHVTPAPARVFRPIGDVLLLWQTHGRLNGGGAWRASAGAGTGAGSTGAAVVPDSKIAYDVSTKVAPLEVGGAEIDVFVDRQVVRLVGRVSSAFQADEAEEAAGGVHGVRQVVNDLAWPR